MLHAAGPASTGRGGPVHRLAAPRPSHAEVVNIRVKAARQNERLEAKDPPIRKIIYDFNPGGRASTSTDYGDCRDLADYLSKRRTIKTHRLRPRRRTSGHAILPVLACQEIVMSRDAMLGDVLRGAAEPLEEDQIQLPYEVVAARPARRPQ